MSTEARPFTPRPCPACKQPSVREFRPFCSRGCRDRDLIGWFDEDYRIPVRPAADEGDDAPGYDPNG
jgi:uncharacterized protein